MIKSSAQPFAADVQWDEAVEVALPSGTTPPFAVDVRVVGTDADEPAANGSTELAESAGTECTMQLEGTAAGEETLAWLSWEVVKTEPYTGFGWLGNPSKFQRLLREKDQFLEEYFQLAILQVCWTWLIQINSAAVSAMLTRPAVRASATVVGDLRNGAGCLLHDPAAVARDAFPPPYVRTQLRVAQYSADLARYAINPPACSCRSRDSSVHIVAVQVSSAV